MLIPYADAQCQCLTIVRFFVWSLLTECTYPTLYWHKSVHATGMKIETLASDQHNMTLAQTSSALIHHDRSLSVWLNSKLLLLLLLLKNWLEWCNHSYITVTGALYKHTVIGQEKIAGKVFVWVSAGTWRVMVQLWWKIAGHSMSVQLTPGTLYHPALNNASQARSASWIQQSGT